MLRKLKNSRAQANIGEYALLFFLAMAFMMGMAVYFQRAVQARINQAAHWAVKTVHNRAANSYNGVVWLEYEPYYIDSNTVAIIGSNETRHVLEAQGTSGIFKKEIDNDVKSDSSSVTAPPKDAK